MLEDEERLHVDSDLAVAGVKPATVTIKRFMLHRKSSQCTIAEVHLELGSRYIVQISEES